MHPHNLSTRFFPLTPPKQVICSTYPKSKYCPVLTPTSKYYSVSTAQYFPVKQYCFTL